MQSRIIIQPFEIKYLGDYYREFTEEITKYQWPDPFATKDEARKTLQGFLEEMKAGETLLYSILSKDGAFLGSTEVHGLTEDCPEIGVWIIEREQRKGYAYEALSTLLERVRSQYNKTRFYFETDIQNAGSMRLLQKLKKQYDILEKGFEEITTDSGKELKLKGYIIRSK